MVENRFIDTTYGSTTYGNQRGFPAVKNYTFEENIDLRSKFDTTFRWEDVYTEGSSEDGLDFVLPKGYILQFSPDLGYKNAMEHFVHKGTAGRNSLIRESSVLTFENGGLEDSPNNSVKTTLTETEFRKLLHNAPYQRYFWRAISVYDDGSHGLGGYPAFFYYKKVVETNEWTIEKIATEVYNASQSIRGTKTENILEIEINGSSHGVYFPSKTSWAFQAVLAPGLNKFQIRAKDKRGNWSSYRILELTLSENIPVLSSVWNTFDEFGTLMGVKRLPGENNVSFRRRIKDTIKNNGGLQYLGVLYSSIRSLDSKLIKDAFKLKLFEENSFDSELPRVVVRSHGLFVSGEAFFVPKEVHKVDPITLTIKLNKKISSLDDIHIAIGREEEVEGRFYKIDIEQNQIVFSSDRFANQYIHLSYYYEIEILWKNNLTVKDVRNALNSIQYPNGEYVFKCELSTSLNGSESSNGLLLTNYISISTNTLYFEWSEIWIREMNDIEWRDSFLNEDGNFFETEWMKYVQEILSITKDAWGLAVADVNTWDASLNGETASAVIPRKFDSRFGFWKTKDKVFSSSKANYYNYVDPETGAKITWNGVPRFKSGVGFNSDLFVNIYSRESIQNRTPKSFKIIVSDRSKSSFDLPLKKANF